MSSIRHGHEYGAAHVVMIGVIAAAVIGGIAFLFWQNFVNKGYVANPSSYAECVKAEGSVVQESYPEKCVAKNGTSFVNPAQLADAPKVAALKEFCAPQEKICFSYPEDWTVKSVAVTQETYGTQERFIVSDTSGKPWLKLDTGMGSVGGACGNEDGSFAKVIRTHTTGVSGNYLVNEGTEQYVGGTAYAVSLARYDAAAKNWSVDMLLNLAKATQTVGKIDVCDVGIGILSGKNAKADPSFEGYGALSFRYYANDNAQGLTYESEAKAMAVLDSKEATQAFAVLQSAHYK